MKNESIKKACEWWESTLTSEKRTYYRGKYSPDYWELNDAQILSIWEKETGKSGSSSSIGELEGWYFRGKMIASENDPKGRTIATIGRGFTEEEVEYLGELIASAPALKEENERLKKELESNELAGIAGWNKAAGLELEYAKLKEQNKKLIRVLKKAYSSLESFQESEAWKRTDDFALKQVEEAIESNTK